MPGVGVVGRGAEAFVVELATALSALPDFSVTLFCRGPAPDLPFAVETVRALPRDQPLIGRLYRATRLGRKALDTLFLDPLSLEWYTAALSALPRLWRGDFDVVVMEGGLVGAWLCRMLRRARGVPFVDLAHGLDPKWEGAFARQRPDRVITFTEAAAEMIRSRAPEARISVIPHGVDLALFRPDAAPVEIPLPHPIVLAAGAVDGHKRMELAVEAAARAGASLVVLGDGPDGAALDRSGEARLTGRYLRRAVPRHEMPRWYSAADCFTLPSRSESFGLAYLEAMACGRPAVAPDDAVRREVVGEGGLLCDVTDAEAYARTIGRALERDWNGAPRRQAERFPVTAMVSAYAELLRELSAAARERRR